MQDKSKNQSISGIWLAKLCLLEGINEWYFNGLRDEKLNCEGWGSLCKTDTQISQHKMSDDGKSLRGWMRLDWRGWGRWTGLGRVGGFIIAWVRSRLCLLVKSKHILGRGDWSNFASLTNIKMCQIWFLLLLLRIPGYDITPLRCCKWTVVKHLKVLLTFLL